MKELTNFEFQGNNLRVIEHKGEPWFVNREVCRVLGIANPRDAIAKLKPHQKDYVGITDAIGRLRETSIISEGGLYKLAFQSRKPEAEAFADLVVDVILPSIRKTGTYIPEGTQLDFWTLAQNPQLRRQKIETNEDVMLSLRKETECLKYIEQRCNPELSRRRGRRNTPRVVTTECPIQTTQLMLSFDQDIA